MKKNAGKAKVKKMAGKDHAFIIQTALLTGKLLLENGAEISRVEDTMERVIRKSLGTDQRKSYYTYVTLTGVFVKTNLEDSSFLRIDTRGYNLEKIVAVNQISRDYQADLLTLEEMESKLQELAQKEERYPMWKQLFFTALLSGSIVLIFGGHLEDLPSSMTAGVLAYYLFQKLSSIADYPFILEFVSTFIGCFAGFVLFHFIGQDINMTMIGTVIPLVPGIGVTNAIRDLMSRHYLSGIIRLFESLFIAAALGCGVALVFLLFHV
ncbi:threonine/serine exporter family protein [Listeria costaricensis]|uniref:threonine/serine exporter family protein n=1 Tax=Listeria costaricensis TaxID=2026604 RepID=UPI001F09EB86|nr:threonine/serine exporter family protein [Listeria costaricensis]